MKHKRANPFLILFFMVAAGVMCPDAALCHEKDIIPAYVMYADDYPLHVSFFFEGGSPIERMTGRREKWYALYESSLRPGYYRIMLKHGGEPSSVRLYVLESEPSERFNARLELPLERVTFYDNSRRNYHLYQSNIGIAGDFKRTNIHFILEWTPPPGRHEPIQASFQIITLSHTEDNNRQSSSFFSDKWTVRSPLESQNRRGPIILPNSK